MKIEREAEIARIEKIISDHQAILIYLRGLGEIPKTPTQVSKPKYRRGLRNLVQEYLRTHAEVRTSDLIESITSLFPETPVASIRVELHRSVQQRREAEKQPDGSYKSLIYNGDEEAVQGSGRGGLFAEAMLEEE